MPPSAIQHLLRELAPRVLGTIVRRYRDFAGGEDAVQEALLAASQQWPTEGVPEQPLGWLVRVATRRITDEIRGEAARRHREKLVVSLIPADEQIALAADEVERERDDTLDLFFMCSHASLSASSQIALTLRAIGGLTTAEIARAFLVPESTMAQRLSRAKQSIREAGGSFDLPSPQTYRARVPVVLHVLYLIFNEGYAASSGDAVVRVDLSNEAIRVGRLLLASLPDEPEVVGLLALMMLTDARRAARTGPHGELVPLDRQDRARWDRARIAEGTALVDAAMTKGQVGPFQLQAAIAALHDEATSTETTDWRQIEALYSVLLRIDDNPMAKLSHAIALAMVDGPRAGLDAVERVATDPRLAGSHRIDAARAHLLERLGDLAGACACYRRAAEKTTNVPERTYLLVSAARLAEEA